MKNKTIKVINKIAIGFLMVASSISYVSASNTQSTTMIGRYLNVTNQPLPQQESLLDQTFEVRFPVSVKTVGDGMNYLLRFSGYSLVSENALISPAQQLMKLPLPQSERTLGPLTLRDGLLTLAGKPFGLLIDPVHRLIAFRLVKPYQSLYQEKQSLMFSNLI
jgi:conjugative transfer region protein (TIGR03748 family)